MVSLESTWSTSRRGLLTKNLTKQKTRSLYIRIQISHTIKIRSLKEVIKGKSGLIIESLCNNLLYSPWKYSRCAQNFELCLVLQQHCPLLNSAFVSDKCSSLPSLPLSNLQILFEDTSTQILSRIIFCSEYR